jgi:putative ABC transport system ATP-binding protein
LIKAINISFQYNENKQFAFPEIELHQGEQALLLGASGSGKSTYMNIIGGLHQGYKGDLSIADQTVNTLNANQLDQFRGKEIGIIFQESNLVQSLSLKDNLLLRLKLAGKSKDQQYWNTILETLGINDLLNQKAQTLSMGERQRANIALAIIAQPKVILADEPTSALDDENAKQVIGLLKDISEQHQITLLIITHDKRVKDHFNKQYSL